MSHQTEDNPFNMVFRELWNMLTAHPRFERDIREGNRIRFDSHSNRDPIKKEVQDADLPEVTLFAETISANLHNTSSTSKVTRVYTIMIATGDARYTERLGPVEWYVFTAMTGWQERLTTLLWENKSFVKRVNIPSAAAGVMNQVLNRNISGWSAVWRVEVEMHFDTDDLRAEFLEEPIS